MTVSAHRVAYPGKGGAVARESRSGPLLWLHGPPGVRHGAQRHASEPQQAQLWYGLARGDTVILTENDSNDSRISE